MNQKGFTIVELIAVIMIIGIISSVAAPKFIGNDAFAARGAHGTLITSLRLAQKTAIAQRTTVFANINSATRVICLGYDAACNTPVIDPATQTAYTQTVPATVNITTTLSPIQFTSSGKESANNTVTLTVQNNVVAGAYMRNITIEADTGYVH
jgi:MSHA pilin protein MshC